ncbi:hypothetical protein F5X99DRAFT_373382 [Biscogniauxia marginata]|nr:hypothetical protein F5X99DRAFT_373382 [Biscogniauxia marginata]
MGSAMLKSSFFLASWLPLLSGGWPSQVCRVLSNEVYLFSDIIFELCCHRADFLVWLAKTKLLEELELNCMYFPERSIMRLLVCNTALERQRTVITQMHLWQCKGYRYVRLF